MASSSRNKQDKNAASEISSARSKLDDVLQTLRDKAEDSTEPSDEECTKYTPEVVLKEMPTSAASPAKRLFGGKTPRKRRRKDDTSGRETIDCHYSYVMKLFDRSVDLAKFDEDTPLYPICRAWMYNEPYNGNLKIREPSPVPESANTGEDDDQNEEERNVYHLPSPLRVPKSEGNSYNDLRLPAPLPPPPEKLDIYVTPSKTLTKDHILSNHMIRWKQIRQKWKEAALVNEGRYKESLAIIKSLKVVYE